MAKHRQKKKVVKAKKRAGKGQRDLVADDSLHMLDRLYATIESRKGADPRTSYTARLMARGQEKLAQKLGEEATEAVIEAVKGDADKLILESADLLYHLLALWATLGVKPTQVWAELARREGVSGIAEKAARTTA
ncbi:phosphoribosyl-ATP diphosphatase [Vineibacter terrae]|uniref:phosphoribosyl-ATP diphosphatase n=1 Tax=Vineibacter terrae TaxID=2586908 RepID=UPI002E37AD1D|nr:phosphoribosyl-ATP diphosphatase [Vineibacter terrae]HEX2887521.1 phosphoribosyl-ATP diphosphatase [Vineibacter terrae]